jgi:hypothetical protein
MHLEELWSNRETAGSTASIRQLSTQRPFGIRGMRATTALRSMQRRMFEEAEGGQARKANGCPTLRSKYTY